ncbi:acyltransferase family protein [Psychrobacillus soli]|uniref:Acyltransferase 3 domain-containing protein n=1 Tax=Psychrobacillus soli TaxID=1543965 RepID=A0A544TL32_9BACI|nr:acyltransferase family protein [Psychrobacillus soli]TQR18163.1 hypothetical protein FG383_03155 [Psychrobacillus soli]
MIKIIHFFIAVLLAISTTYSYIYISFPEINYKGEIWYSIFFLLSTLTFLFYYIVKELHFKFVTMDILKSLIIMFITSVIMFLFLVMLPLKVPEEVTIEIIATGEKDINSNGTEVWLKYFETDKKEETIKDLPEGWDIVHDVPVSYQGQPASLRWKGYVKDNIFLVFAQHPYSGGARVIVNDKEYELNLYSKKNDLYELNVNLNPVYSKNMIFCLISFTLILTLVFIYFYYFYKKVKCFIKNNQKKQEDIKSDTLKEVDEIYILRAVSCLAIVFIHSISSILNYWETPYDTKEILTNIQMFLMFGTPVFIFISEFVISYKYKNTLKTNFLRNRLKFILIPYFFMALLHTIIWTFKSGDIISNLGQFSISLVRSIFLGEFIGYFILIIFQFYIMHILFVKYISNHVKPKYIIAFCIIINVLYLGFFNFSEPITGLSYLWERYYMLFPAWLIYFCIGYYSGVYYSNFKKFIVQNSHYIMQLPVVAVLLMYFIHINDIISIVSSKRIDIVIYTLSMVIFIFCIGDRFNNQQKKFFKWMSSYSIGIYLLHPIFILIIELFVPIKKGSVIIIALYIVLTFIFSVLSSMMVMNFLNRFNLGKYLVGNLGKIKRGKSQTTTSRGGNS